MPPGRLTSTVVACACLLLAPVSPVSAATTIGQLDPAAAPSGSCFGDWILGQDATSPAGAYEVPAAGVITSWSHKANAATARELGLTVFRRTAVATDFTVVGGSGIKVRAPSTTNTFAVRIGVKGTG
jgi:hypothetical protein